MLGTHEHPAAFIVSFRTALRNLSGQSNTGPLLTALFPFTMQLIAVRLNLVLCNHIQLICERRTRCPAFVLKVFVVAAEYIQQARALNLQRGGHRQPPVAPPRHNTQHRAGEHRHSDRT